MSRGGTRATVVGAIAAARYVACDAGVELEGAFEAPREAAECLGDKRHDGVVLVHDRVVVVAQLGVDTALARVVVERFEASVIGRLKTTGWDCDPVRS